MRILEKTIFKHVNEVNEFDDITDYKTKLQELVQSDDRKTVSYHVKSSTGPANAPEFVIEVILDDMILGVGKGTSKKACRTACGKRCINENGKEGFIVFFFLCVSFVKKDKLLYFLYNDSMIKTNKLGDYNMGNSTVSDARNITLVMDFLLN